MEALAKFELDLVAGGVTAATPWKSHVGLTRTYLEERWLVGFPAGTTPPNDLEGVEIAVPDAGPAAAWVKEKGARPLRVRSLELATGPLAAPEWRLRELGRTASDHTLHTVKHVLAAAPGENALIVRLEEHLHQARLGGRPGGPR